MSRASARRRSGFAMLPVVLALALLATTAYLMTRESASGVALVASAQQTDRARYLAEAALRHADWQVQSADCNGFSDVPTTSFGADHYSATVTPTSGSPITVAATGTLADGTTHTLARTGERAYETPTTLVLQPDAASGKDTYLYEWKPDWNYGASTALWVRNDFSDSEAHAFLVFDELSGIPPDAMILSAVLELHQSSPSTNGGTVSVRRVPSNWIEGSAAGSNGAANWNERDTGAPWISPGGDFYAKPAASADLPPAVLGWFQWDLTALVSDWVRGTQPNRGLALVSESPNTYVDFDSSDQADPSRHPKLTITWACECGQVCETGGSDPYDVLLVVGDAAALASKDVGYKALIESSGHTVTLIDDGDTQNNFDSAMAAADVIYVSGSSSGPSLLDKLTNTSKGMVNEVNGKIDNFGFSSSTSSTVNASAFSTTNAAHYITEPFGGNPVTVFNTSLTNPVPGGTLAPDLKNVGEVSGTLALGTLLAGATRYDGNPSQGRRAHLPFASAETIDMTADGTTIVLRALEWAAGGNCSSLKPLLLVVSDADTPSLQEAARQELLESWCYAVTRIDDDATTLELAAAMALPDVIYISQEITTLGVVSKLREANVGIVNEEYQISGELGFSSGYGSGFYSDIDIRDDTHYITSGLGLGLLALFEPAYDIYTGAGMTLAPDLQVLGATGSITGLAALDTGAALWGSGAAAGRRVLVPWGDDFSALNSDGQALMQRALEWAAGAGCGSRQKVLLVVGDDTLPLASRDAGRVALIESGCFTVSLIDDGDTQTNFNTAMDAADVVFVSGTSSGPALLDKLTGTTTGVVNEINGKLDNFGFSSSTASTVNADTFSNTDAAHYISEPFSGSLVTVFTTSLSMPVPGGTLAPDLQNVGEVSGTLALGTLETGATRWDGGVAPARRVHLPFGSAEITQMTADGQTLLQRAVEWAAGVGGGGGGGGPVSNVVFEEFTEERRSSPGGESVSIPKPAGTAAGDLLIVAAATDGNTASTLAPNGSWNLTQLDLGHNGNGSVTFGVWWKIADGTEPANLIYSWTGSEQAYGWIMRFTGHDPGSPIATAATSTGDSTDPLSTNLITSEDGMLILRLGGFDDDDITLDAPGLPGHTVITMDRSGTAVQNTVSGGAGYAAQATAGDTGTSNFALTKREQYRSVTIAIRPAP